jgi:dynein heavy chain, axonemal
LEKAKDSAVEIAQKLEQAKVTTEEIELVRVKYIAAAMRGAVLFFVMAGLSNITNMYEYSLSSFLTVFKVALNTSKRDPVLDGRILNIIEATTIGVYNYTCLGLFERHKLMFSFQVCARGSGILLLLPLLLTPVRNTLPVGINV